MCQWSDLTCCLGNYNDLVSMQSIWKFHRLKLQAQTNLRRDVQSVRKENVTGAEPFKGVQLYDKWILRPKAHVS